LAALLAQAVELRLQLLQMGEMIGHLCGLPRCIGL
jgi:hypothetical protein